MGLEHGTPSFGGLVPPLPLFKGLGRGSGRGNKKLEKGAGCALPETEFWLRHWLNVDGGVAGTT